MKVISLLQPWASLVVMGYKKIETRSWNTKHRGPLLIHASASQSMGMKVEYHNQFLHEVYNRLAPDAPAFSKLPFGAIIGKVELVDTIQFTKNQQDMEGISLGQGAYWEFSDKEVAFGDYTPGRYGWLLRNPIQFNKPIPAKGAMSLWDFVLPLNL